MYKEFKEDIEKFNKMYELPCNDVPTNLGEEKFLAMVNIIDEELEESGDIFEKMKDGADDVEILTDISDWLNDIIVYCCTFQKQWGLDPEKALRIIMESNFSKLDDKGNVIKDERGKVMKGDGYWKPEPLLKEMIKDQLNK